MGRKGGRGWKRKHGRKERRGWKSNREMVVGVERERGRKEGK